MYIEASDRTIYYAEKGNLHILAQDNNSSDFWIVIGIVLFINIVSFILIFNALLEFFPNIEIFGYIVRASVLLFIMIFAVFMIYNGFFEKKMTLNPLQKELIRKVQGEVVFLFRRIM